MTLNHSSGPISSLFVAANVADDVGDVLVAFFLIGDEGRIIIVIVFDGLVDLDVVFRFGNHGLDLAGVLLGVGLFFLLRRRKNRNPYAATAAAGSSQFSGDADEYALSPQSPSERYAYMAEKGQAAPTTTATAVTPIHEMSGERDGRIAELPVTGKGAPSMAGGEAQAGPVELYSP